MTERIQRIFVEDSHGDQQTLAFDIDRFVSYNVDTRCLTLTNGVHYVHPSSEDRLIKAYRDYFRTYTDEVISMLAQAEAETKTVEA